MPNAFDLTSLTVKSQADAQIRMDDHPNPVGPGEPYSAAFLYYRGINPFATGFALDWYETEADRNAAVATQPFVPGRGNVITAGKPIGEPRNARGGEDPLEGNPLLPAGQPQVGVATGQIINGRAPSAKPDGSTFDEDKEYFGVVSILQA